MRRCDFCGRYAAVVIRTVSGLRLGWSHRGCARQAGMVAL